MGERRFRQYTHQNPLGHIHEEDTPYLGEAKEPAKPAPSGQVRNASKMENSGDMRLGKE
ncbi:MULTISPECIES: hypothetical protein [Aneurinibacillus]|jgi:hypothetical protein|uniref:Uncharacterized protein n=1 Tax=Aneurinibacillus thermoaerophilus TaxID=143495 RepID=A0A1G7WV60_ANETH|nr:MULTISPECIES: hypothetical protein [Aneurinibacillus]MED0674125.1 hypothetical protein [Aneurinibacillus thermoaerophilus]MED0678119.1 hypothetical protein [Aneurinibacillus thermoaerophilus]MED0737694.1 hypothetical protein [Aneurinibacillus thermoaerophilus]MED0755686.1 hypothetical protein [Aneurinibacillus thermoaerophilus]MED0759985.1 hypothetical protein [Aneurinibacillus thermoaerophilus]